MKNGRWNWFGLGGAGAPKAPADTPPPDVIIERRGVVVVIYTPESPYGTTWLEERFGYGHWYGDSVYADYGRMSDVVERMKADGLTEHFRGNEDGHTAE